MDLTDVNGVLHGTTAQYTFFSATHGTLSKIDHNLGQKKSQQIQENGKKHMHSAGHNAKIRTQ
jgi:hypothetical protein